jgi:SNF2 family DNA or RNA helicase
VLKDLPEKIEQDVEIALGSEQREAYDRARDEGVIRLNAMGESITIQHVLALITKLRQLCSFDPASGESAKADRLTEDLEEVIASQRKALVFTEWVSEDFGLQRLGALLEDHGFSNLQLYGDVKSADRPRLVQTFNAENEHSVMLLNYRVGGLGLNLQGANYVYLFDRPWNPALEDQAVKRAHRIGQNDRVFVRRFFCKDTIEEHVLRLLQKKRRIFANVIDDSRISQPMGLSEEEIFSLFNLKVRPKRAPQSSSIRNAAARRVR